MLFMIGNAIGLYQCHTNMGNALSYNIIRAIDITVGWEFSTILISYGTITIYIWFFIDGTIRMSFMNYIKIQEH